MATAAAANAAIPIEHWRQGGAGVWLVRSPAVPMVDVRIDFDAGGRRDPPPQAGLAAVSVGMMSKGLRAGADGAPALDENALGEAWADLGAVFAGSDGTDRVGFTLRTLAYPDLLARAVALAARQLAEPAFDAAVWERERQRLVAALRESLTRPGTVAARAYAAAVYGGHPYGQEMSEQTLARIGVADMQAWHAQHLRACHARVSIVGALTRAQAQELVAQLLARLPADGCAPLPPLPEVPPLAAAQELRIPFDSAQAHVLIGQPGIRRADPDFFALTVGNYILGGGGFVSRLSTEVREQRGLSYSVHSSFSPGLHAGAFTIALQTRPDQAEQAVQVARAVLRRFVAEGPTAAELKAAQDNLIGGFALRLDSNRKLLEQVAHIAAHDLPLDYLDGWTQRVARVTRADIRAAFARVLQPDRMVTVIVGGRDGP